MPTRPTGAVIGAALFREQQQLQQQSMPPCVDFSDTESSGEQGETSGGFSSPSTPSSRTPEKRPSVNSLRSDQPANREDYHRASRWGVSEISANAGLQSQQGFRATLAGFLVSSSFDIIIGTVIVGNAITIGLEQAFRGDDGLGSILNILESVFLSIYIAELAMRFFAFGSACLADSWVVFDLFLVVMGIVTQWILKPILGSVDEVGPLMVLRTVRLMRLAKTVRLLIKFKELWMLVQGLLSSANTMIYTLLLLFVIIYMFACLGVELLVEHPKAVGPDAVPEFAAAADQYFGSLPTAMLSLMQFVILDNVVTIYLPLARQDPILCLYFIALILIVGIVVMNLVTAVVVNSALEQAAQDKNLMKVMEDERRKTFLKELRRVFERLDEDKSGTISPLEIKMIGEADLQNLQQLTGLYSPMQIFDALDVDRSGNISISEFCDELWEVAISQTPLEIKRMDKQIDAIRRELKRQRREQQKMSSKLADIHEAIVAPDQRARNFACDKMAAETIGAATFISGVKLGKTTDQVESGAEFQQGASKTDELWGAVQARCERAVAAATQVAMQATVPAISNAISLAALNAVQQALNATSNEPPFPPAGGPKKSCAEFPELCEGPEQSTSTCVGPSEAASDNGAGLHDYRGCDPRRRVVGTTSSLDQATDEEDAAAELCLRV